MFKIRVFLKSMKTKEELEAEKPILELINDRINELEKSTISVFK